MYGYYDVTADTHFYYFSLRPLPSTFRTSFRTRCVHNVAPAQCAEPLDLHSPSLASSLVPKGDGPVLHRVLWAAQIVDLRHVWGLASRALLIDERERERKLDWRVRERASAGGAVQAVLAEGGCGMAAREGACGECGEVASPHAAFHQHDIRLTVRRKQLVAVAAAPGHPHRERCTHTGPDNVVARVTALELRAVPSRPVT